MSYDYSKLSGRIVEKCRTKERFAKEIGLSCKSLCDKMQGKVGWSQQQIAVACKVLEIKYTDIPLYFFVENVQCR